MIQAARDLPGLLPHDDVVADFLALAGKHVNYDAGDAGSRTAGDGWHHDDVRHRIGQEPAGAPVPGGAFEVACRLVRAYEFSVPHIIRAVYRADAELLGRDMLLEARFYGLRFTAGVRVVDVVDRTEDGVQVWGWGYRTLDGHFEQGHLDYQVRKDLATGAVEFRMVGYSRRAPIPNPVIRAGLRVFARWMQLRFYRGCGERLERLVAAELDGTARPPQAHVQAVRAGFVLAPSDAWPHPLETLTKRVHEPGDHTASGPTPTGRPPS